MFKKISYRLDRIVFLVVPLILSFLAVQPNTYGAMVEWGEISLSLLYLIIFMKPALVVLGHPIQHKILHFRRHLGMLCFWLAFFHTGGIIRTKGWRDVQLYFGAYNYLFWGALSMIGMLLLGITTNYRSIKKMGKRWKRLQYLVYPVLLMTLLHEALIPGEGNEKLLLVAGVFLLFLGAKFVEHRVKKKQLPSLYGLFREFESKGVKE